MGVRIRLAESSDVDAVVAIYRRVVETTPASFETVAPGRVEMARRIDETLKLCPWLVCDIGGQIAGYAYANRHRVRKAYRWSVDASVYVDERYRRRGVGRGLYASLFAILSVQGYFNAYAGIALPNPSSIALHESMGFEKVGVYRRVGFKLGQWHDVGWWQLVLKQPPESPPEPLGLKAVSARRDWDRLLAQGQSAVRDQPA